MQMLDSADRGRVVALSLGISSDKCTKMWKVQMKDCFHNWFCTIDQPTGGPVGAVRQYSTSNVKRIAVCMLLLHTKYLQWPQTCSDAGDTAGAATGDANGSNPAPAAVAVAVAAAAAAAAAAGPAAGSADLPAATSGHRLVVPPEANLQLGTFTGDG